jgi:exodeoxyribonuclease VII small subunit
MGAKKAEATDAGRETPSFELAMDRLEAIVKEMEAGALPLDSMIARFEEGQGLIRLCSKKLNEVEKRIEKLVRKGDEVEAVPFEPGAEPAGEGQLL